MTSCDGVISFAGSGTIIQFCNSNNADLLSINSETFEFRNLRLLKPWLNRKPKRSFVTYRIKWEALEDKEVRKRFAFSISPTFRLLPDVSEDNEKEWLLFRSAIISSAAESCGQKRPRVAGDSEKRTPRWNQDLFKEAIRAKKDSFNALLQERLSSDLLSRYTEAWKAATSVVKKSKEKLWEEFGRRLDSNYFLTNKVFWQTIRGLRGKRSSLTYSIRILHIGVARGGQGARVSRNWNATNNKKSIVSLVLVSCSIAACNSTRVQQ